MNGTTTMPLYFASLRRVLTGTDIFWARRQPDGGFEAPQAIEEVATAATDGTPVLSFDMLTMYFDSTRTDNGGDVHGDIWAAHRASLNAPFGEVSRVAELNDAKSGEFPTWLSPDNCRLYLSSDRSGVIQSYVATRTP